MPVDLFGLSTEDYFSDPLKTFLDAGIGRVEKGEIGLYLDGPDDIADTRETAPIVIQRVSDSPHATAFPFLERAIILAIDLYSDRIYSGGMSVRQVVRPNRSPDAPPPPPGLRIDGRAVDLFQTPGLATMPARYSISAVVVNQISGSRVVNIGPSVLLQDKSRFYSALFEERDKARYAATPPASPDPAFNPLPDVECAPRFAVHKPDKRTNDFVISGEVCVESSDLLPAEEPEVDGRPVVGILPVHLIATGSKSVGPFIATLRIPAFAVEQEDGLKPLAGASFSFNVFQFLDLSDEQSQTFFVYIACRDFTWGPVEVSGPSLWRRMIMKVFPFRD